MHPFAVLAVVGTLLFAPAGAKALPHPKADPAFNPPAGFLLYGSTWRTLEQGVGAALQPDGKLVVLADSDDGYYRGLVDGYPSRQTALLLRYLPDGTRDPSFGVVEVPWTGFQPSALALQPDGKIVVAGCLSRIEEPLTLLRFDADGRLDRTFGLNGRATFTGGERNQHRPSAVAVLPDGKIVVAGMRRHAVDGDSPWRAELVRLHANGLPDPTFGSGGAHLLPAESSWGGLAALPNGKILVSGTSRSPSDYVLIVGRFGVDGTPDHAFGREGFFAWHPPGVTAYGGLLALQPDGKIVVPGTTIGGPPRDDRLLLLRLKPDGSLDRAFGAGGVTRLANPLGFENLLQAGIQPDGGIVAMGMRRTVAGGTAVTLRRFTASGQPDLAFGVSRGVVRPQSTEGAFPGFLLDPAGRIYVAGTSRSEANGSDVAVDRLTPSGNRDDSFGLNGRATYAGRLRSTATVRHAVVEADGRLLVAYQERFWSAVSLVLRRYGVDGAPDSGFNGGRGHQRLQVPAPLQSVRLAVQPDGKILLLRVDSTSWNLFRFLPDGTADLSFGVAGVASRAFPAPYDRGGDFALTLRDDGRILVAGAVSHEPLVPGILLVRLGADGAPDVTFGGDGEVLDTTANEAYFAARTRYLGGIHQAAQAAGGDILVFGLRGVFKYDAQGAPDLTFCMGQCENDDDRHFLGDRFVAYADGSYLLSGQLFLQTGPPGEPLEERTFLSRHLPSGHLDPAFGTAGVRSYRFPDGTSCKGGVIAFGDGSLLQESPHGLQKLDALGEPDWSFGETEGLSYVGRCTLAANNEELVSIVEPDGDVVVFDFRDWPTALPPKKTEAIWRYRGAAPQATAVRILGPPPGERIVSGTRVVLTWEAPPEGVASDLATSCDGGETWVPAVSGLRGRKYSWNTPAGEESESCLLKVAVRDGAGNPIGEDVSDGPFTLTSAFFSAPAGWQRAMSGSQQSFRWDGPGLGLIGGADLDLSLSLDDGVTWAPLFRGRSLHLSAGTWMVPAVEETKPACRLKIEVLQAGVVVAETIGPRFVVLKAPAR